MTPEAIARAIADALDDLRHDGPGLWTIAHVDSEPTTVWIEATDDNGNAQEFRLTVERQS